MQSKRQVQREARALWRLCLVDGRLEDDRARLVVDRLVASGRADAAATHRQFVRRVRLDGVNRTAVVSSAVPLDPTLQARVAKDLVRLRGQSISTIRFVPQQIEQMLRPSAGQSRRALRWPQAGQTMPQLRTGRELRPTELKKFASVVSCAMRCPKSDCRKTNRL